LGRIAAPLFLALDVIGGVKDQVSELEDGAGLFATMGAVFKGVMDGIINFVLFPIELLKDAVSWVAGKLGFEQFESILDSFDIVTVVQGLFGGVFDSTVAFVTQLLDNITEGIAQKLTQVVGTLSDLFQGDFEGAFRSFIGLLLPPPDLLKFNLPEFDLGFAQFGGGMVNLNPIPDAAYEFAGLPTPTRPDESGVEAVVNRDGTIVAGDTLQRVTNNAVTNEIATQTIENTANSQSAPIVIQDNSVNSSQQSNVSNNTSAPAPMRSPVNNNRTRASAYAG
jgi:hypothetical protein